MNRPIEWSWIVTPKKQAEGVQAITWDIQIDDGKKVSYTKSPAISIGVNANHDSIRGIPVFLLRSELQISTFVTGMIFMLIGYWRKEKERSEVVLPKWLSKLSGSNTKAVRELITTAFDDEEFTSLCFDHFRPVHNNFSTGMSKTQKIQLLLDYCERYGEMLYLVHLIRSHNPSKFNLFKDRLGYDLSKLEIND